MNGWGHYVAPVFWLNVYWAFGAGVLVCLAYAAWVRGAETRWRRGRGWPCAAARAVRGSPSPCRWLALSDRRVHLLQHQRAQRLRAVGRSGAQRRVRAGSTDSIAICRSPASSRSRPTSTSFPESVAPRSGARTASSIAPRRHRRAAPECVAAGDDPAAGPAAASGPRSRTGDSGYAIYELETPLAPGQEIDVGFHLEIANPGFVNNNADTSVVENGTFFHSRQFPAFGYLD